ncbi:hypothetical protein [Kamptonema formosum]|nr:hypothetical protein [Oscillatoria sp. PCC 10802]
MQNNATSEGLTACRCWGADNLSLAAQRLLIWMKCAPETRFL